MGRAIDTFTVIRGGVVAVGWTSGGTPDLLYEGRAVKAAVQRVRRQDLIDAFGEKAARWGFTLAGVAPVPEPAPDRLALRFSRRDVVPLADLAGKDYGGLFQKFIGLVAARGGSVIEIGSRARSGHVYRTAFPATIDYVGVDVLDGPNVDVVGDAHHLSRFTDRRFDFAFSISVFEHLLMPWKAAIELNKVLTEGGLAYIHSHPAWPLHEMPWDFWRFSDRAWHGLFNRHTGFEVMETEMGIEGLIAPNYASAGPANGLDRQRTFLASGCLVRKVAAPQVEWAAEVAEVYDLGYDHA
ncbi:methyltransferase domain-containing protein [Methylobacterium oryzisoli]|uniref:methyltransferase domain-containing protein n=1 Tax=Methylobacterium oryzisoli TaxID=3385502 RepID=UPI003891ABED